jgi:hypothetical protein
MLGVALGWFACSLVVVKRDFAMTVIFLPAWFLAEKIYV